MEFLNRTQNRRGTPQTRRNMDSHNSENAVFKTAELVRDEIGCYYFICKHCGKQIVELDDMIQHIENYITDENETNALTPLSTEAECMLDYDQSIAIKKESFEEYEEYKIADQEICHFESEPQEMCHFESDAQEMCHFEMEPDAPAANNSIFCPLCDSISHDVSLESHLIQVHNRSKKHASIYECEVCGKNTFTRSYDLKRHGLIHSRADKEEARNFANLKNLKESFTYSKNFSYALECESHCEETVDQRMHTSTKNSSSLGDSYGFASMFPKRLKKEDHPQEMYEDIKLPNSQICQNKILPSIFCPLCKKSVSSKTKSLEMHLIRVHHRNKLYSKIYECKICHKNSFTRPYDLKRHQLTHKRKDNANVEESSDNSVRPVENLEENCVNLIADVNLLNQPTCSNQILVTNPKKTGILCAICDAKFESYNEVTVHLRAVHNKARTYKCTHEKCEQSSFPTSFELHRHELSHFTNVVLNNKNRMRCIFCKHSFGKKWNLMKHEKRHLTDVVILNNNASANAN